MEEKVNVLIADPSQTYRTLIADRINAEPDLVLAGSTACGQEALQLIRKKPPDVIVLDVILCHLDGIDVLRTLEQMGNAAACIMTASFYRELFVVQASDLGVMYFLLKPFTADVLLEKIRLVAREGKQTPSFVPIQKAVDAPYDLPAEVLITNVMHELGIPAHVKGYPYIREAIRLTVADMDMKGRMTTKLYARVAETFDTTPARVERAIRHAVELAWERGDVQTLQKFFGYTISKSRGKPTNSEFVAKVADRIILQQKMSRPWCKNCADPAK